MDPNQGIPLQGMGTIIYIVALVLIFYFILIRPQKKKEKAEKAMREAIKKGDLITTIGGVTGKVLNVKEDTVVIETGMSEKCQMVFKKWAVQTVDKVANKKAEVVEEVVEETTNEDNE